MKEPIMLLDGHRGVYIPQNFAEEIIHRGYKFTHTGKIWKDLRCLLKGPDNNEWYWEAWASLMDKLTLFSHIKGETTPHILWQNDDLWAVPEGFDIENW